VLIEASNSKGDPVIREQSATAESSEPIVVDALGVRCPIPVLRLRKAARRAAEGQTIVISCDDPLAQIDIPNASRELGLEIVANENERCSVRYVFRKRGAR
jgi:tRNA 2-thiouridine synthesizing protein A